MGVYARLISKSARLAGNGGGLLAAACTELVVNNSKFESNIAASAGSGISGHYIEVGTIANSRFSNNEANNASGLLFTTENTFDPQYLPPWIDPLYRPADVMDVAGRGTFNIKNSVFSGNVAHLCGGGIFLLSKANASISQTLFQNNAAEYGAGLFTSQTAQVMLT